MSETRDAAGTPESGSDPGAGGQAGGAMPDLAAPGAAGDTHQGATRPPAANQARHEPIADAAAPADPHSLDTTGSMTSANPQAPSAVRVAVEADTAGRDPGPGVGDSRGVVVPPAEPAPGTSQESLGVADVGSATPVDPGHQAGGIGGAPVAAAHRPHAPDGEVSPR